MGAGSRMDSGMVRPISADVRRGVRRMTSSYCHPALKQLKEQQARFAPRDERLAQIDRAETLLAEIRTDKQYPYEYLWYRIKGYRPETAPELLLDGSGVRHDLRLFIEELS